MHDRLLQSSPLSALPRRWGCSVSCLCTLGTLSSYGLCLRQHVLPDTNVENFEKKGHEPLETAYYTYGDKVGWHELRKRVSSRPPPRVFSAQLTRAFGHFVQHCSALLNDSATMQRLQVQSWESWEVADGAHGCCAARQAHGVSKLPLTSTQVSFVLYGAH